MQLPTALLKPPGFNSSAYTTDISWFRAFCFGDGSNCCRLRVGAGGGAVRAAADDAGDDVAHPRRGGGRFTSRIQLPLWNGCWNGFAGTVAGTVYRIA
jgi:hypothetical protein